MDTCYEIGKEYSFDERWKIALANIKESKDIERIQYNKIVMFHAYMQYEFQHDTQDHVSLAFFLSISLLGFSPSEWELDENYITPFESIDEKYPNNPYKKSGSFREAESEPYYDIKADLSKFPYTDTMDKDSILPYILISDIKKIRLYNESIIWLESSYNSHINKNHPDKSSYQSELDDLPIYKTVRYVNIPLSEEYSKRILRAAKDIEYEIEDKLMTNTTLNSIINNHISSSFKLIATSKHIYPEEANSLRFTEDVDSNKNLKEQIYTEIDTCRYYPEKELTFSSLMEIKNPAESTSIMRNTEYFGLFRYMNNNRVRGGQETTPFEECYIKLPLLLMKNLEGKEYGER